tara:strand:- start:1373 stop:1816 length:444 start_codon:yes stop_codon:yes gene_type:complete
MAGTKKQLWGNYRNLWSREKNDAIGSDAEIVDLARLVLEAVAGILGEEFTTSGPTDTSLRDAIALEDQWRTANQSRFIDPTYTGDNLTQLDYYDDNLMTTLLFTKVLGYTGDNLTSVVVTDVATAAVLTTTIAYAGDEIDSITKIVS